MKFNRKKIILISIIGLVGLLLVGGGVYYFVNKNAQTLKTSNQNQLVSQISNQELDTGTKEEIKKQFKATEIISNNLPNSIEFWTEAYCPGTGSTYNYNFDNIGFYFLDSCEQGEIGSHGGCKTCVMSKIKLASGSCESDKQGYYKTTSGDLFVEYVCPDCDKCQIKIFGKDINQTIEVNSGDISFDDYNFDGYSDLKVSYGAIGSGAGKLNENNEIYLFNKGMNSFVYNKTISGSTINIDKDNKEVSKQYVNFGAYAVLSEDTVYKWIGGKFELVRKELYLADDSGVCREKIEYYVNNQLIDKVIKNGNCSDEELREYSHILDKFQ